MNNKIAITTSNAPQAVGPYSQAVQVGDMVYLSGQIPLKPDGSELVDGDITAQAQQIFTNLEAVAHAAGGNLNDIVKLTIYLTDMRHFSAINECMSEYFSEPYPARATIEISALPLNAAVEMDAIMVLPNVDN